MIEKLWAEFLTIGVVATIATFFGIKVAHARTEAKHTQKIDALNEKIDALEKLITTKFEDSEKSQEQQAKAMGREIGEIKTVVKKITDDFYAPVVKKK